MAYDNSAAAREARAIQGGCAQLSVSLFGNLGQDDDED